jgi:hypothetical protein
MNRNLLLIEKIIAATLVIYSFIILYSTFLMINTLAGIVLEQNIERDDFLLLKISGGYSLIIAGSALTILGGVLLFLNKKVGWIISVIASFLLGVELSIAIIQSFLLDNINIILISARILLAALFYSFTFCLLLRPFRIKYKIPVKV